MSDSFRDPDYAYPGGSLAPEPELDIPENEMPFDPVLRLALIKKGLITPEDLMTAQKEIKVVSSAFIAELSEEVKNGGKPAE